MSMMYVLPGKHDKGQSQPVRWQERAGLGATSSSQGESRDNIKGRIRNGCSSWAGGGGGGGCKKPQTSSSLEVSLAAPVHFEFHLAASGLASPDITPGEKHKKKKKCDNVDSRTCLEHTKNPHSLKKRRI